MSLDPKALRGALTPLFDPSGMPTGGIPDCVMAWLRAYVGYAQAAVAGGTTPATLLPQPADGPDFFTALDTALRAMWMAVAWAGPGLAGTTSVVPPLQPFTVASAAALIASSDPQLAPSLIADALHTYTLSIVVAVVPSSGTPFTAPLT